ncbi:hypothetical protein GmRootV512_62990 [Variovorax sp. V512]
MKVSTNSTATFSPRTAAANTEAWSENRPAATASFARQKVSVRHSGNERFAEKPSIFSPSHAAPGTRLRRFSSQGMRLARCA